MGNATLGNTAGGNSVQFWFQDTANGVSALSSDTLTFPEDAYVDALYFFCKSESTNAGSSVGALYTSGAGTKLGQTPTFTLSTTMAYHSAPFSSSSLLHLPSGSVVRGALLESGGGGLRIWGRGDGGSWSYITPTSSLSAPYSGTVQSGLGNFPWYLTYFKACTVTGYAISGSSVTNASPGDRLTISGRSFSSGVLSVDFNGTPADMGGINVFSDSGLNINVPNGATTGPVHVVTNAGTGTGSTLTIAGAYVFRSSAWANAPVLIQRSGVETNAQGVLVYRSGSWINAG